MTQEEMDAQLALADARLRVANGDYVTPEEYAGIIQGIQRGVEARAASMAGAAKDRAKAKRAGASQASCASLLDAFKANLESAR